MSKLSETIRQAKLSGGLIITTHAAFIGFNDLHDFLKEASDNDVTVTFAPMGSDDAGSTDVPFEVIKQKLGTAGGNRIYGRKLHPAKASTKGASNV